MKKCLHSAASKLLGRNLSSTPKNVIVDQMLEPRPLPMGRQDFEEWSDRIISGALLPTSHLLKDIPADMGTGSEAIKYYDAQLSIFNESQKYALANMLMHLGPTESHKPDAFFIHSLRKVAVNQVADTVRRELHEAAKKRTEAQEIEEKEIKGAQAALEALKAKA